MNPLKSALALCESASDCAMENAEVPFRIHMIGCTDMICNEVQHNKITRKDVALSYALALRSAAAGADVPDWSKINCAILDRWSMNALEWIKARAIKLAKGEIEP